MNHFYFFRTCTYSYLSKVVETQLLLVCLCVFFLQCPYLYSSTECENFCILCVLVNKVKGNEEDMQCQEVDVAIRKLAPMSVSYPLVSRICRRSASTLDEAFTSVWCHTFGRRL